MLNSKILAKAFASGWGSRLAVDAAEQGLKQMCSGMTFGGHQPPANYVLVLSFFTKGMQSRSMTTEQGTVREQNFCNMDPLIV